MTEPAETTGDTAATAEPDRQPAASPDRVCPNCGAALYEARCKLLCPNRPCGYFMSCSDFY